MSKLNFDYVPLTFISDKQEIKKQIRNTLILIHLFEKYSSPVRLANLIEGTQYGYNASALQSGKNKFLRISDIHESKVNWDLVPYCNCDDEETYLLKNEDILIARTGGTTGKSFKIDSPPKHSIYAGYLIRIRAKKEVNPDYLYLFLHSFAYWSQIVNLNERNFRPKANAENLKSLILPDCERRIQDEAVRISKGERIKGYEVLFSEIEKALSEYDKTQQIGNLLSDQITQLEKLNQAILQEAVQGKLAKQDPKDEPASELLKRIKAEKAKSAKKKKPLPPIKPEEIPFEIPDNWVWCRLGEVIHLIMGQSPESDTYNKKGLGLPFYQGKTEFGEMFPTTVRVWCTKPTRISQLNDILISVRAPVGDVNISDKEYATGRGLSILRCLNNDLHYLYLFYFLDFFKRKWNSKGSFFQAINRDHIELQPFPLPPLSEQKRIITEIEKQKAKTKQLKEDIIANQHATEQLLKALLHQAFEVEEMEEV
jgi:type I restriction enzyme S subunit